MSEQEAEAVFSGDEETHGEADESNKLLDSESTTIQLLKSSAGASVTIREPSNGDSSYQVSHSPLHTVKPETVAETVMFGNESNSEEESLIPKRQVEVVEGEGEGLGELPTGGNKHTSSIGGASFNFINSIIGSGIIGIPSALQQSGFLFGILLLLLVAFITDYTVILLIKDALLAKKFTYQDMVTAAYGRPGFWYLTLVQFLFPFFAMAGYIVITGDTLSRILTQIFYLADYVDPPYILSEPRDIIIKVAMVLFVMLPLSLLRNISKLEKFSAFAVICIVFIVSVTFYEVTQLFCAVRCFQPDLNENVYTTWIINKSFVQGIGIMGAAFVCHHNTYLIYASLKNRSLKRFSIVSHVSVSTSFIFCAVLGLSGFLSFLDKTQGDLLNNYCGHDEVANSARFFFACVIMLTYPIECFVGREVLEISLARIPKKTVARIPVHWLRQAVETFLYTPKLLIRHIVLTCMLVFTTLIVGASTNNLGVVLAFNGCFTAVPLAFIIPTACFLKLSKDKWCSVSKIVALLVLLFGILVMAIGTVLAVIEAVQSYISETKQYTSLYCPEPDAYHNKTCCQLFEATDNFSSTIALCDCTKLCPDLSLLPILSSNYCNISDYYL